MQFIKTVMKRLKCHHNYEYQKTSYKRKLSRSENPFWYTDIYIHLKCSECEKEIMRTIEWCELKGLPTHEPLNTRRNGKRSSRRVLGQ